MKITHVRMEDDNTVTVEWNMPIAEYEALLKDAEAEVELEGQKWIAEERPENWNEWNDDEEYLPTSQRTTGEKGFQPRDRFKVKDAIEDDYMVRGSEHGWEEEQSE